MKVIKPKWWDNDVTLTKEEQKEKEEFERVMEELDSQHEVLRYECT